MSECVNKKDVGEQQDGTMPVGGECRNAKIVLIMNTSTANLHKLRYQLFKRKFQQINYDAYFARAK